MLEGGSGMDGISTFFADVGSLFSKLNKSLADNGGLMKAIQNFNAISEDIKSITQQIQNVTKSLATSTDTTSIKNILASFESTLKTVDQALAKIIKGDGAVAKLLDDPNLYFSILKSLRSVEKFTQLIEKEPYRLLWPNGIGK